jgi:hypothetical protein
MSTTMDVLGEEVDLPDPSAIAGLADHYGGMSSTMHDVHDQLAGLGHDMEWIGKSANLFLEGLGSLPGDLVKAYRSYGDMATALHTYASGVEDWVGRFTALANQANNVNYELQQTQRAVEQGKAAGTNTAALQAKATALADEVQSYRGSLQRLWTNDLQTLVDACLAGIQGAENAGISNTFWGDVESVAGDVGGFIYNVVIEPIKDLPGAALNVLEHPLDLQDWSKLLQDVSAVVGVASLLIPGLGEVLLPAALAVDAAHLGVDTALVAEGAKGYSPLNLAFDGVAVVGDGAGALSAGANAGDDAVKALQDASDEAFAGAAQAESRGLDFADLDQAGIDNELKATALQGSQSAWSLARQGLVDTVTFKPMRSGSAWLEAAKDVNPVHDLSALGDTYRDLGAKSLSSSASVLMHRVTTVAGLGATAAGTQAPPEGVQAPAG